MHLPGFLADEQLRGFVRAGQLELVLWDHLGECDGPPHMRCWQPIVYRCALAGLPGVQHLWCAHSAFWWAGSCECRVRTCANCCRLCEAQSLRASQGRGHALQPVQ